MKKSSWIVLNVLQIALVVMFVFSLVAKGAFQPKIMIERHLEHEGYNNVEHINGEGSFVEYCFRELDIESEYEFRSSQLSNESYEKYGDYLMGSTHSNFFGEDFFCYAMYLIFFLIIVVMSFKIVGIVRPLWSSRWGTAAVYTMLVTAIAVVVGAALVEDARIENVLFLYKQTYVDGGKVLFATIWAGMIPGAMAYVSIIICILLSAIELIMSNRKNKPRKSSGENIKKNNINTPAQLKQYKELLDSGVINQEEFELKKNQLLNM